MHCKGKQDDAWWPVRCGLVLGRWSGPGPRSGWVGTQGGKPDGGRKRAQAEAEDKTSRESWMPTDPPCLQDTLAADYFLLKIGVIFSFEILMCLEQIQRKGFHHVGLSQD